MILLHSTTDSERCGDDYLLGVTVLSTKNQTWSWGCYRSIRPEVFCKKAVLRNFAKFTGKHLCQGLFFSKEKLVQAFSCEFCEISQNIFFTEHLLASASLVYKSKEYDFNSKTIIFIQIYHKFVTFDLALDTIL